MKCIANGCLRDAYSRHMCLMHYKRWRKYGDPNMRSVTPSDATPDEKLRFKGWNITAIGCWEFRSYKFNHAGYKAVSIGGVDFAAHRVAYEAWVGPIPDGFIVRHKCDNPPCINPNHLEVGTHADNARDRDSRGRDGIAKITGDLSSSAKLSDAEVREIRERLIDLTGTQRALATEYGVSEGHISAIKRGVARRAA